MARVNWREVEREEQAIENDETLSTEEKARLIRDLHRDIHDSYAEQQEQERRDEFGY